MSDLVLHVAGKYFDEIKAGTKRLEYRLQTDYWRKRLVGREYDRVVRGRHGPTVDSPPIDLTV